MMLETLVKGIIIGLSISVPLGPIGMLCIQRTLNRGQKYGIATGIGATFSDLIYSVVTIFFLSFVIDFIEERQRILQFIGSVIILLFGYWIFRSHPMSQPLPNEKQVTHSLMSDFFTSAALTLSNPLILFILIALYSQFDFIDPDLTILEYGFALFSVLLGATLWWTILTSFVSRFRTRFNLNGLKIINKITGGIIATIGIAGIIVSMIN